MRDQTQQFPSREQQRGLAGDPEALVSQLGSPEGLEGMGLVGEALRNRKIGSVAELRKFLGDYRAQVLLPLELPAICRAFDHTRKFEVRELIELDQLLSREPLLKDFAAASQCIGRGQLRLLKPLRDQKLIKRYLEAIAKREAHGWHTVVYGVILSVFSFPLRPGLISYANQTMRGFVYSSSCPLLLSQSVGDELVEEVTAGFPAATSTLLEEHGHASLQLL